MTSSLTSPGLSQGGEEGGEEEREEGAEEEENHRHGDAAGFLDILSHREGSRNTGVTKKESTPFCTKVVCRHSFSTTLNAIVTIFEAP